MLLLDNISQFLKILRLGLKFFFCCRNELDELAEEIGEVNQELRRSLQSIVYSIRGLLTSFNADGERRGETSREGEGTLEGDVEDSETSDVDDLAS